jgi:hypothetical protein
MGPLEFITAAIVLALTIRMGGLTAKWIRKSSRKKQNKRNKECY